MLVKKFFSFLFCFVFLFLSFSLTAFADDDEISFWDFLLSYYTDFSYTFGLARDPDKLVDYWETAPGKFDILNKAMRGGLPVAYIVAKDLNEASDGRYVVAQLHKDQLQSIYDSFNDYWSNDNAEIRSVNLADLDLTYDLHASVKTFGSLSGSGPAVRANGSENYISFKSGFSSPTELDSNTLYLYNGSIFYPPLIYVRDNNFLFQSGEALPKGFYYVLNSTQLLFCADGYYSSPMCLSYQTDSNNELVNFYAYRGRIHSLSIFSGGSRHSVGVSTDVVHYDFELEDALSLFSKAVGFHISTGEHIPPVDIQPVFPDDLPYDDDGNIVVMCPCDQVGDPVYLSPSTFNDYSNSGNISNTDDHSNNVVNGDTINNLTNIYNNYYSSSNFDDSEILSRLDDIIDYLKKIYNKVKGKVSNIDIEFDIGDLLGVDDKFDRNHVELDWKSLVQSKLPILAEAAEVVRSFEDASSPLCIELDIPLPAGDHKSIHFSIDFSWFDNNKYNGKTGREYVREGLSYIVYFVAFVALYRRTDMIFADY